MFLELRIFFANILQAFLNLIYNQKCLVCSCSKTDDLLCKTCSKDIHYLSSFAHRIFDNIPFYSATLYEGSIKKLIHKLKFNHRKKAAIPLAKVLFKYFQSIKEKKDYIIIYPPSYFLKSAQRGYNHMFLIAKEFSKLTNFKVNHKLIKKIKYKKEKIKAKNKHKNNQNRFKINEKELKNINNETILLIDDITTSGATLEEIIRLLKEKNINNIICLTIAKT